MTFTRGLDIVLPALSLACLGTGCFTSSTAECRADPHEGSEARGSLVAVESEASAAELPDYPRRRSITTNGLEREVSRAFDGVGLDATRLSVGFGVVSLTFRRPGLLGRTTLRALDAELCELLVVHDESERRCAPVDGDVDVVAMAQPCTPEACASFDIRVHIPTPETPPEAAFVHGDGRLLHREWTEAACWHHPDKDACLFSNCFLGIEL